MAFKSPRNINGPAFREFLQTKPVLYIISLLSLPRKLLRNTYDWVIGWAAKKQAEKALAGISFVESSVFPIPPDPLLIAMVMSKPERYLRFALICTTASVLGGLFGYFIGFALFETIGRWVVDTYHLQANFDKLGGWYENNALLAVFTAAFTPIPYKLVAISAGVFQVNIAAFIVASILGRGGRFFAVAWLMHHFGRRYKDKIEKYIDVISLAFVALLILGVLALRYIG